MRAATRRTALPFLAAVALAGMPLACSGDAAPQTCEPLASVETPITLGATLSIGRHADGTFYVIDESASEPRVFVSETGSLWRKRIAGSGATTTALVLTVSDATPPFALKRETQGDTVRMGVVRGPFSERDFEIGKQGDELTVVGRESIADLPLRNLPGDVTIEYVAALEDGRALVVTRPTDDWTYDDFRLFFGTPPRYVERAVKSVTRAKDGGTTTIVFDLDRAEATAVFPSPLRSDPATLTIGHDTLPLTLLPKEPPAPATYECR